ncbi:alpha,alpha-trehalose-phosphate synthase (UDP-forming) [Paracraurococcus ruber]|uniref:Trehalose-6-phosphate synthase n=1 Tax=Paracraurococcus ruber TaxID=77675 RepID=A0ABS1D2J6_9PROT|nr:trehalose-6-phosphate synthase [Paracraurococcus ruber]MBK1661061.1 trehalose-6-phosphate synthase [Paracraurococcus ruber]TDG30960.1 trehalose-6-phosphate synthase [Paracraurococcus ruber]
MNRLVVVANRVPDPAARGATAGGLAVALQDALTRREAVWFGWSGRIAEATGGEPAETRIGRIAYTTLDLGREDHRRYYAGFSNASLWPTLHYRLGLAQFDRQDYAGYRAVNAAFADALAPRLRPDDTVWVHDFHLFPMAAELRRRGCGQRIGFFLHVPFPPAALFCALPRAEELLADLAGYDVIGLQTEDDVTNLRAALIGIGQPEAAARVAAFPIGIEAEPFAALAVKALEKRETERFRLSLVERALIIGVDRLDYTKGLPQRFCGYGQLLARFKAHRSKVTYLQVAPVSRGDVAEYRTLRRELDEWVGRINGQHAEPDWAPLRYMTRAVARPVLAGFMRMARVGLVTPLRDGMNLVAKEYVAAQDPEDPGVLVLSRFAGAVAQLPGALLVNPLDPDEIAEALDQALRMPREERQQRWQDCAVSVFRDGARAWCRDFLAALEGANDTAAEEPVRRRARA